MRVRVKLKELTDVDPRYISLVGRGANRIPFRIVKSEQTQEQGMIDLTSVTRVIKGAGKAAPAKATVSGIVVIKGSDEQFALVTKAVAEAGYKTDDIKDMGEGAVMFAQCADADKGATVVRVSDATVVLMKSYEPFSKKLAADGDYDEGMKASDFHQGVAVATVAYNKAVGELTAKGETDKVAALTQKFNSYVATLMESIPGAVFKMDSAIAATITTKMDEESGKEVESEEDKKKRMDEEAAASEAKKADDAAAAALAATEAAKTEGQKTNDLLTALVAKFEGLEATVKKLEEAQAASSTTAKEAVAKADGLEKAMKGLVPSNTSQADRVVEPVAKAAPPVDMIIDTALQGRAKKYDSLMTQ